jgi:hypothetical protein
VASRVSSSARRSRGGPSRVEGRRQLGAELAARAWAGLGEADWATVTAGAREEFQHLVSDALARWLSEPAGSGAQEADAAQVLVDAVLGVYLHLLDLVVAEAARNGLELAGWEREEHTELADRFRRRVMYTDQEVAPVGGVPLYRVAGAEQPERRSKAR